jgi:hypothetical protein
VFVDDRVDFAEGEFAGGFLDGALLFSEGEIHGGLRLIGFWKGADLMIGGLEFGRPDGIRTKKDKEQVA